MSKYWLENIFWAAQALLALIALIAAIAAFAQFRAFKLFEMLKYIESPQIRASRRIVLRKIAKRKDKGWWKNEELERAASDVCASYDILALAIEKDCLGGYALFKRYWARSILDNHEALKSFLEYRRQRNSQAYRAFSRLADEVRPYAGIVKDTPLQRN